MSSDAAISDLIKNLQQSFKLQEDQSANREQVPDDRIELIVKTDLGSAFRIEVRMERNHARAHFHAKHSDACDISVDIESIEILAGECRGKMWKKIRRWAYKEREKLHSLWHELNNGQKIKFKLCN